MTWQYTFIRADGSETVLPDEPVQWDNVSMVLQRDQDAHGISFLFSSSSLEFVEAAYWILKEEYVLNGVDGYMDIRIDWKCDDCTKYNSFIQATLNFGTYKEYCGAYCYISMGIEQNDATMLLTNRKDTNVDISSTIAYDGTTVLNEYTGLGTIITIPSKAIKLIGKATKSADSTYDITEDAHWNASGNNETGLNQGAFFPSFDDVSLTEISTFNPQAIDDYLSPWTTTNTQDEEFVSIEEETQIKCLSSDFNFQAAYKATMTYTGTADKDMIGNLNMLVTYPDGTNAIIFHKQVAFSSSFIGNKTWEIDESVNVDVSAIPIGSKVFFYLFITSLIATSGSRQLKITSYKGNFLQASATSLCAPSPAKTFLIHETGARILEHITDNQLTFKSAYYGRTDSQPFTFPVDGCGGLRAITNGLLLRRAVLQDNSTPNPFTSWKDFADTCKLMDCTGYGIEGNVVRLEPVEYFYKRVVVFVCDGVDVVEKTVRNDRIWSTWKFGYDKYETESANGLDAIHTKREYRTSIRNSSASLEQYIKYIHDPYAIEATRRKYGTTQDWRYDNNIFGFCLQRGDIDFEVEQGNIINAANLFDPATIINYRVSPIHNALRWFNWVAQGIKPLTDSRSMLFNAGEGNYVAEGQLFGVDCKPEAGVIAENEPLSLSTFADPNEAISFIEPEQVTFTYPLGLYEFLGLKDNMYGLIKYRRYETDDWSYGWIDKLEPNHEDGDAKFTLVTANSDLDIVDTGVYINGLATEDSRFILDENGNIILIEG